MDQNACDSGLPSVWSAEVPHLVLRLGRSDSNGLSWRCRLCRHEGSELLDRRLNLES
jgi:hypothetical protein